MEKKKLTLEDLKLESFLTEIDNSKLIKVQGGNGAYSDTTETEVDPTDPEYGTNDEITLGEECDPTGTEPTYGGGTDCGGETTNTGNDEFGDQTEGSCDGKC